MSNYEFVNILKELNINNKTTNVKLRKAYVLHLNMTHGNTFRNDRFFIVEFDKESVANRYGKLIVEKYKEKYADDKPFAEYRVHESSINLLYEL